VTFITAVQYLESRHLEYGGHMAAAMALMESPAIIFAVILSNTIRRGKPQIRQERYRPLKAFYMNL
jgi:hypothetical protein